MRCVWTRRGVTKRELGVSVPPSLCAALLAMSDADGDDKISLKEFLQLGKVLQDVVRRGASWPGSLPPY